MIDTAAEGFFALGFAVNDVAPIDEELAAPDLATAQRRRDLSDDAATQ